MATTRCGARSVGPTNRETEGYVGISSTCCLKQAPLVLPHAARVITSSTSTVYHETIVNVIRPDNEFVQFYFVKPNR